MMNMNGASDYVVPLIRTLISDEDVGSAELGPQRCRHYFVLALLLQLSDSSPIFQQTLFVTAT